MIAGPGFDALFTPSVEPSIYLAILVATTLLGVVLGALIALASALWTRRPETERSPTTMGDATILRDYGDRALATWLADDGRRVIAWVGPEPLRSFRVGIELDREEQGALVAFLINWEQLCDDDSARSPYSDRDLTRRP